MIDLADQVCSLNLPGVFCELSRDWGSNAKDYRKKIRQAIAQKHSLANKLEILDLEIRPKLDSGYVSISHCPGMGGYAFAPAPIGFDIEESARIKPEIVKRVTDSVEQMEAPDLAALWVAKEAIYKSLPPETQPQVISDIKVGWNNQENFYCKNSHLFSCEGGKGFIIKDSDFLLALFLHRHI